MSVIERAIEIHYATFPRAPRDGLAHPFGAVDHDPHRWRVSQDIWDELMALRGPFLSVTTAPKSDDRLLGESVVVDDELPPNSMVLEPMVATMVAKVRSPRTGQA